MFSGTGSQFCRRDQHARRRRKECEPENDDDQALRDAERAIEAFLRAVNINPALPASWNALRVLYKMTGRAADAQNAAGHAEALSKLPPEILTATDMFADGEIFPAERIVRDYLLKHGNHVDGMRLLAKIGMKLEVLDDAEFLLDGLRMAGLPEE